MIHSEFHQRRGKTGGAENAEEETFTLHRFQAKGV
jgi:hypothetical protein